MKYLVKFQGKTVFASFDRKRAEQHQARYGNAKLTKLVIVPVTR